MEHQYIKIEATELQKTRLEGWVSILSKLNNKLEEVLSLPKVNNNASIFQKY